ncbi:MAG TPA: HD domain-containing protein [Candidatus Limnocylindrales bacterium]|nr:HD domain-containing protein [Candidatus Limnocylindrales bacterium]
MPRTDEPAAGRREPVIPAAVQGILETFWANGHAAYVVGGSLRDELIGRRASDWDLATDARPDRIVELFPGAVYENKFGTVDVRAGGETYQVTTFRTDHDYGDHRRPHHVEFGDEIETDLARRDFTVNAIAWGARGTPGGGRAGRAALVDPFGGALDVERRLLRAVGEPTKRFEEDALRMIRGVRLAATLEFAIEPATLAAITDRAALVEHLSGERIGAELGRLLGARRPSVGLRLMADSGLLDRVSPELAAQRGIAQNKVPGEDLWDHTLRAVDAAPAARPVVRLAALVHDIGKPATAADGHFYGHERVGADVARAFLERVHYPRAVIQRVVALVRQHMFAYEASWSDAAVRRFIGKVGRDMLDELFELRMADNAGSGLPPDVGIAELRRRVEEQLAADVALDRGDLAIDGDDLIEELGVERGPAIGRILGRLLDRVIADPALNERPTLLLLAATLVEDES